MDSNPKSGRQVSCRGLCTSNSLLEVSNSRKKIRGATCQTVKHHAQSLTETNLKISFTYLFILGFSSSFLMPNTVQHKTWSCTRQSHFFTYLSRCFSESLLMEYVSEVRHLSPKNLKLDQISSYLFPGIYLGRQPIQTHTINLMYA